MSIPPHASKTPFLEQFYPLQQLSLELTKELAILEKIYTTRLNNLSSSDIQSLSLNLEDPEMTSSSHPILTKINYISVLIQRVRALHYNCQGLAENQIQRSKLSQIEELCEQAANMIVSCRSRIHKRRQEVERESFLFGNPGGNSSIQRGGYSSGNGVRDGDDDDEKQSLMGGGGKNNENNFFSKEQNQLNIAFKSLQSSLNNAYSSIDSLSRQRELFENIQRKTGEIMGQLGFSNQTITWIQRQENLNLIITLVGMFVTLFIIVVFYYWWNHKV